MESREKQEEAVDHRKQAEFAAQFLIDGPGDVRNDGAAAYAIAAQVHATLSVAEQLERLNDNLEHFGVGVMVRNA